MRIQEVRLVAEGAAAGRVALQVEVVSVSVEGVRLRLAGQLVDASTEVPLSPGQRFLGSLEATARGLVIHVSRPVEEGAEAAARAAAEPAAARAPEAAPGLLARLVAELGRALGAPAAGPPAAAPRPAVDARDPAALGGVLRDLAGRAMTGALLTPGEGAVPGSREGEPLPGSLRLVEDPAGRAALQWSLPLARPGGEAGEASLVVEEDGEEAGRRGQGGRLRFSLRLVLGERPLVVEGVLQEGRLGLALSLAEPLLGRAEATRPELEERLRGLGFRQVEVQVRAGAPPREPRGADPATVPPEVDLRA